MGIGGINVQTRVRIWVGSDMYLSDKWDSGEILTSLKSMYYGGGHNLEAGKEYYAHIQTYSDAEGWGSVQVVSFIMPK